MEIKYVTQLPMVNTTDSILVTQCAVNNFINDREDFFKYWVHNIYFPKILSFINNTNRLWIWNKSNLISSRRMLHVKFNLVKTVPKHKDAQIKLAKKYFTDSDSIEIIKNKLTATGLRLLGIYPFGVFDLDSYPKLFDVFFRELAKRNVNAEHLYRQFAIFLHSRNRFLWTLGRDKYEMGWGGYPSRFGHPFNKDFCNYMYSYFNDQEKIAFLNSSCGLMKATRWQSIRDLSNIDIRNISNKLEEIKGGFVLRYLLRIIIGVAIDNGAKITFIPLGELKSKSKSKGKLDGSFIWLKNKGEKYEYWRKRASDFCKDLLRNGRAQIIDVCYCLNHWFDYICYLDLKNRFPQSLADIRRNLHIEYRPSVHEKKYTFTEWLQNVSSIKSKNRIIWQTKSFFDWIIAMDSLNIPNPIFVFDAPKMQRNIKSSRTALSIKCWCGLQDLLLNKPPVNLEKIRIKGKIVKKQSPSLSTYMLLRLVYGLRHHQVVYLDMNNVLTKDGILISGDKNQKRLYLQIAPYISDKITKKIQECIEWQRKYNYSVKPIWYMNHKNSPYGKVKPLFRKIGRDQKPFTRNLCSAYMVRLFLKYQKEFNVPPSEHIVVNRNGSPLNLDIIDPDTMSNYDIQKLYKSIFDLHSFRVTAATIWYEAGVPLEVIADLLTGHSTLAMLMVYVKIRDGEKLLKEKYQLIKEKNKIENALKSDPDSAINKFFLRSNVQLQQEEYLDGITQIKNTSIAFWRFFNYGICPTGACLNGLPNKCSLCPQFITGPTYKNDIAAQFNLTVERLSICISEIVKSRQDSNQRQAEYETLLQELVGWYKWFNLLENIDKNEKLEKNGDLKPALFTQIKYEPKRSSIIMLELQRCVDVQQVPEVYSEYIFLKAKEHLLRFIQVLEPNSSPADILSKISDSKIVSKTANYFLNLLKQGVTENEIELMLNKDENFLFKSDLNKRLPKTIYLGGESEKEISQEKESVP